MEHLLTRWNQIEHELQKKPVMLCLDYDGTLVPIRNTPSEAKLSPRVRKIIQELASQKDFKVVIVSGRSLPEIKKIVGLRELVYVANHGLELEGPQICFTHPNILKTKKVFATVKSELLSKLESFPGLWIEDKALTMSIHYRQLKRAKMKEAETIFLKTLKPYRDSGQLAVTNGKKVWEVRPPERWNKGSAVLWLFARALARHETSIFLIYIGDDQTDEDAFNAVKHKGIGIKVTKSPKKATAADYYLRSPTEVYNFLKQLRLAVETVHAAA